MRTTSSTRPYRRPQATAPSRSILRGELDKFGLVTLLTILEMERRSGVLLMQRGRELGRLFVRDGQVVRARIEGSRKPAGVDAVYEMLGWPDGQFELWHADVGGKDEIGQRTAFLLMEGMRRLDEARTDRRAARPTAERGAKGLGDVGQAAGAGGADDLCDFGDVLEGEGLGPHDEAAAI